MKAKQHQKSTIGMAQIHMWLKREVLILTSCPANASKVEIHLVIQGEGSRLPLWARPREQDQLDLTHPSSRPPFIYVGPQNSLPKCSIIASRLVHISFVSLEQRLMHCGQSLDLLPMVFTHVNLKPFVMHDRAKATKRMEQAVGLGQELSDAHLHASTSQHKKLRNSRFLNS